MERRFDTLAVHAGEEAGADGALDPPIVLANAFAFASARDAAERFAGTRDGMIYTRWRNPSVEALERKIAALEGAERCVALASGMAAVHASIAAFVSAGDHVIAPRGLYAETARVLRGHFARFGVETTFVDTTDLASIESALRPSTRVVYVETPANPTLAVTDIEGAARIARAAGAVLIVDSTFATPYHQRPLEHGSDLVLHSATKALGGHGDAIGGVVAGRAELVERVREEGVRSCGGALSPLSAMLIARGVRTLALRMERASASALELSRRLSSHPRVERVSYPGLASHPGHTIAARQMRRGFGALVAFEVRGGAAGGARVYDAVDLIARAVSLGDVRSLLTHPASTTHASLSPEQRREAGIGEGLMRLSVGIEDVEDLWRDLDRALAA
ncbi:MAG TPA: aminotransferase class I/II-fold pyridoxal phosphate-dependent enzyme [Sandaracinaceae bacterium]